MKTINKYKLELTPYFNCKDKEKSDLSANYMYGKFLSYLSEDDYIGASLAKRFIRKGWNCCNINDYPDSNFKAHYKEATNNPKYKMVKNKFYCEL
tara:strand:- start:733 stop:1017 length:285 start_codon:yes stop_codon:yes gene_type:complete